MNRTILTVAGVFSASSLLLVDSAVKGTALLVLAAALAIILRRDSAATRHLVWLLAIVAMLAVPVLSAMLPQWRVLPEWASIPPATAVVTASPPSLARPADGAFEWPQNAEPVEIERPSAIAYQAAAELPDARPALVAPEIIPSSAVWSRNWLNALPLVWATGFCVLILRLMAARWMLWNAERLLAPHPHANPPSARGRELTCEPPPPNSECTRHDPIVTALEAVCLQLGIGRPVALLIHPDKTIPVVWGILRCRLLLPAAARDWSGEQLRSVLLHELAHIKRGDTIAQLLTQIACALHWFNPLVWFAAWRLGVERERACDDLVLASGVRPSAYAGHLLEVVTQLSPARWTQSCGLAMARPSSLEGRLVAVLSKNLNRRGVSMALAAIALGIGAGIAVPVAMLRAVEEAAGAATTAATDEDAAPQRQVPRAASESPQDEQPAVKKPKHESGQRLFKIWQENARTDGKIPGGALQSLADAVKNFIKLNPTNVHVPPLTEFLKRIDISHDWTPAEAVELLDDLTAIYATLPDWAEFGGGRSTGLPRGPIRPGMPLPAELEGAAWGQPAANGLRAAWVLEPGAEKYPLGTNLKSRILFHNSGTKTVVFCTPDWHQYANHEARDGKGAAIRVSATEWTRLATLEIIRLAPGEYAEAEAHAIGIGPHSRDEVQWEFLRVGAWIEAKAGDEVTFQPGAVTADHGQWTAPAERKTPAEMWKAIVQARIDREAPLPAAAADREQLIRRVTVDLIGVPPAPDKIAAFAADDSPDALAALAKRLVLRITPFAGALPAGAIKFRVTPADPDAAKKPRVATRPGWYTIGDHVRLVIAQKPDGKRRVNEARISFYSPDQKAEPPGKPHEIKLPDGHLTWAIAWERGITVLWVVQKGLVRSVDFTNPAQVKETRFEEGGIVNVPEQIREALKAALNVPGAPVQQQESQKPNGGAQLRPGTERKLQWGEPVNGLRAALAWPPTLGEPAAGEVPDFFLAVQNVSEAPVRLCTTSEAPNQRRLTFATSGVPQGRTVSSEANGADATLKPREVVFLRLLMESAKDTERASRGSLIASAVRQSPAMTLWAELEIARAPAGAWTGKLVTPETRAGVGAEAPKNRKAQELFKVWLGHARVNGKIPGGCIARLGDRVKEFVRGNLADKAGEPYAKQMEPLVARLDGARDWQPVEASALLTDIAAVSDSPLSVMLEETAGGTIQSGPPLDKELENAPWGEALPNGLRVACLLEPRAAAHRLGTPLKMRILVHNAGRAPVVFRSRTWHHIEPTARNAKGAQVEMESVTRYTRPPLVAYRLEPGRFAELASPGIGIGKHGFHDFKKADIASWISAEEGDEVTLTPGPVPLGDWNEASVLNGQPRWWLDFLTARLTLAAPLPAAPVERAELLQRTVRDIFHTDATAGELASFVADREPDALESLAKRLAGRSDLTPFSGSLQSGTTKFRVTAADPGGAKPANKPAASPAPPVSPAPNGKPKTSDAGKPRAGGDKTLLPKHKGAQELFKIWNAGARGDGKIPGALIGLLAESVTTFTKYNPKWETTPQLLKMLPRLDATRDWSGPDALALLDELAAVQATPIDMALDEEFERTIRTGTPLPPELANAPWGEAHPSGLRLAWLLEPRTRAHRLGTPLSSRILIHNAGKEPVVFRTRTWHQGGHTARDAKGADIKIDSTQWLTRGRLVPFRLAPGEFVEVNAAGIGVGANQNDEDWLNTRVGSWVDAKAGDDVTVTTAPVPLSDWNEDQAVLGEPRWWLDVITARLARHLPLPAEAHERERLLDRVAMELFGTPLSAEETAAFVADREPNALDSLAHRLVHRPGISVFLGSLQSAPTKFHVLRADPDAAKKPRTAGNPGRYTLAENVVLAVTRRPVGERLVNEATIQFFSPDPAQHAPGEPHEIKLPDGYNTWAAAWVRGATVLWVSQKGLVRKYDFTNPAQVQETPLTADGVSAVPEPIRDALQKALDVPGAPKQEAQK